MRRPEWPCSLELVPARLAIATGCAASNGGFQLGYHRQAIQGLAKIVRARWYMSLTAITRAVCTIHGWRSIERLASDFGDRALCRQHQAVGPFVSDPGSPSRCCSILAVPVLPGFVFGAKRFVLCMIADENDNLLNSPDIFADVAVTIIPATHIHPLTGKRRMRLTSAR